jgi:hypothetical protein
VPQDEFDVLVDHLETHIDGLPTDHRSQLMELFRRIALNPVGNAARAVCAGDTSTLTVNNLQCSCGDPQWPLPGINARAQADLQVEAENESARQAEDTGVDEISSVFY